MSVTCSANGRSGQWKAVCLDFGLAVQGESFQAAFDGLNPAIKDDLAYIGSLPIAERTAFFRRRVSLTLRLGFLWRTTHASLNDALSQARQGPG